MTKKDFEKAQHYLRKNLKPIYEELNSLSNKNLKKENELLSKALNVYSTYSDIIKILNDLKKSGRPINKKNEIVMHMALEDCIKKLDGIYPTFKQFQMHWDNPKKYIADKSRTDDAINGIGFEKLKKFHIAYRSKKARRQKLIELGIIDCMVETKTRLSDIANLNFLRFE